MRRVDLGPAIAGVAGALGANLEEARFALFSSLRRDEITATAEQVIHVVEGRESTTRKSVALPASIWSGTDAGEIHRLSQPDFLVFSDTNDGSLIARLVHFEHESLLKLWPSATFMAGNPYRSLETVEAPPTLADDRPSDSRKRGGAPMKHDWVRAAAFMASFVIENDYPTAQGTMVEAVRNHFSLALGSEPDKREVERFVSELYRLRGN